MSTPSEIEPLAVVDNPEVGGTGGRPFSLFKQGQTVKRLRTWTGERSGDGRETVIKGLQVVWSDNSESHKVGEGTEGRKEFQLGPNSVVAMTFNTGYRVDRIHITTDRDVFVAGGNGGTPTEQNVGNGTLLGFKGHAAEDIDRLGSTFRE
ncbi:hypothetical protein G3M48_009371 [Beauveria asiatica]|uniref:Jacalin-type lectin domain-containing protein n=1 Tax=Beauveria asiatica TaxID=1069075 RepID=A0AAW0S2E7_9HYPO